MKVDASILMKYAFVGTLLVLLIVVIATTPNPTWMDEKDPYTLSGDKSDAESCACSPSALPSALPSLPFLLSLSSLAAISAARCPAGVFVLTRAWAQ
eukprot:1705198-Rhodomonas_salina.2